MKKIIFLTLLLLATNVFSGELNDRVKKAGYKGIHTSGIGNFLYGVKQGKKLKNGKNWVFWSDVNARSKKVDKKFKAKRLMDGYILYGVSDVHNDELIEFTIAVPNDKDDIYLTNQSLRDKCHSFEGNLEFETFSGGSLFIPLFKPLPAKICPGK